MGERFAFGPFVLDDDAGTLLRDGVPAQVGYRGLLLLKAFLERPGAVLTKADLFNAGWHGALVEETNLSVQIAALRKQLGSHDGGDWITTIPRVGYRFAGQVERLAGPRQPRREEPRAGDADAGLSIAVLPFANLSNDEEQEFFADGIVEDIITGLSRLRGLLVIARNSSYAYKGKAPDIRQVAKDLGVRYVLEGSVRKIGDRLRVTSQLADASTGGEIWAERYDRATADVFAVQDEITESVVASIEPHLYAAEYRRIRSKPPERLDAWAFVVRALPQIWTWGEKECNAALADLRRAIATEPEYARAHSLLAWTYITGAHMGWASFSHVLAPALEAARRSIEFDGEDPWGHLALGYVHMLSRDFKLAASELAEALWLNPNFALAHLTLGAACGFGGAADEGLKHLAIATRLSPRDPHQAMYQSACALCHFVAGRYTEAAALNLRAVQQRPRFASAWRSLAAASAMAGDLVTAEAALAEVKRLQPELSIEWVEANYPMVRVEDRSVYMEGLRRAGLHGGSNR